jgi:hypothetical protein
LGLLTLAWLVRPTASRADLVPFVGALSGVALFAGWTRRLTATTTAWASVVLAVSGLLLLNLSHQPSRLPLIDTLRSAYWSIPLPVFLYRNTPWILFSVGVLVLIATVPRRRRTALPQRSVVVLACLLASSGLLFPGALYRHEHVPVPTGQASSAVPVMVDGVLEQRLWSRSHETGRPMLLATGDKIRSDHALAEITHGLAVATLPGGGPLWLSPLWAAQRVGSAALSVGRVVLLPGVLLVGLAGLAGSHRPIGALRWVRGSLAVLLLGPVVFNGLVLVGVAVGGLETVPDVVPALVWQLCYAACVVVAWLAGDVLAKGHAEAAGGTP